MKTIGLTKRLIVVIYDGLLLFAVVFFTCALLIGLLTAVFNIFPEHFYIDPNLLKNEKITELNPLGRTIGSIAVTLNTFLVTFVFYGWFWTHGGQTLGMKAWNLYLVKPDGKFIDWKTATKRYFVAIISWAAIGLGFTWILLNSKKRAWHDIATNTQIIYSPPQKNKKT